MVQNWTEKSRKAGEDQSKALQDIAPSIDYRLQGLGTELTIESEEPF